MSYSIGFVTSATGNAGGQPGRGLDWLTGPRRGPRARLGPIIATVTLGSLLLAILFFLWGVWGVRAIRKTLVAETERDALALLESLSLASQYSVATGSLVDQLEHETQAGHARNVEDLVDTARLDPDELSALAAHGEASGITVWVKDRLPTSYPPELARLVRADTSAAGYRWNIEDITEAQFSLLDTASQARWAGVGVPTDWGGLALWERVSAEAPRPALGGIGQLIQQIGERTGINYVMLQSPDGIVFASRPLKPVLKLAADSFLVTALEADTSATRELTFEGMPVLEAVAPFLSSDLPSGMLRVGISLTGIDAARKRLTQQLALAGLLLLLLSTAVIAILVTRRSLSDLGRSYRRVETMTGRILDAMDQAVIAADGDGRITVFNPAAETQIDRKASAVLGTPIRDVLPGQDFALSVVGKGGEPVHEQETKLPGPRGNRELVYTTTPISASGGSREGAVAVIRDETEARALAAKVRHSERLSAMGQLAAGVAHEVRNPLNAIALAAQRLRAEAADPDAAQLAAIIWDESKRLNAIVEDFLSLARPSTQPRSPLDLAALTSAVAQMAKLEADKAEIQLEIEIQGEHVVDGVADELRKAIWNIIANALAASARRGLILIDLRRDAERSCLVVEDQGSGIASVDLPRIFEPWFTTKSGGTGLGLAITHRIISDHRGSIDITSPLPGTDQGTRVTVTLPARMTTE